MAKSKNNCPLRKKIPAQNGVAILEYILVSTAVVSVLVVFLGPLGIFQKAYSQILYQCTGSMVDLTSRQSEIFGKASPSMDMAATTYYRDPMDNSVRTPKPPEPPRAYY